MIRAFAALVSGVVILAALNAQTPPAPPKSKEPVIVIPDAKTLNEIKEKRKTLGARYDEARSRLHQGEIEDLEVYLKAIDWITRHKEFWGANAGTQTLAVFDALGKRLDSIQTWVATPREPWPWVKARGKPVIRGYRSRVDGSVQPYAVTYPTDYSPKKSYRLDLVLHGRDNTLTEVKFIHGKETAKVAKEPLDQIVLEVYGRGNNAYRWAGERDVFEALADFRIAEARMNGRDTVDPQRIILRGFSMGGAGTWHIGLHHPSRFAAIGPGAGFSTTKGYVRNLPNPLPDYIEKCLHIYDAVDYAENVVNVPVVAYTGSNDPQIAATRAIQERLKQYPEIPAFTHLVAPGLEHKMPPEWMAKADAEYRKHIAERPKRDTESVRAVSWTPKYGDGGRVTITELIECYQRATVTGSVASKTITLTTTNVRSFTLVNLPKPSPEFATIDGDKVRLPNPGTSSLAMFERKNGHWGYEPEASPTGFRKTAHQCGPIDDAFTASFYCIAPEASGGNPAIREYAAKSLGRFDREWDRYFRGSVRRIAEDQIAETKKQNNFISVALFGDPGSNPAIAEVLPRLPIRWTSERLEVNGKTYDARTHIPVLIYPSREFGTYVVLNSGHTFHEADFKGTNALLYPRLGDWAVLKLKPTEKDPLAAELVDAGLFDSNWQFRK